MTDTPPAPESTNRGLEHPSDLQPEARTKTDREVFAAIAKKYRGKSRSAADLHEEDAAPPASPAEQPGKAPHPEGEAQPGEPEGRKDPSPARKEAEQFLRLKSGVPDRVLATATDEEIQAWVEERRTRESMVDRAFSRAAQAEKELERLRQQQAEPSPKEPKGPTQKEQFAAARNKLAEALSLTDDERAVLDEFADALTAPLRAELERERAAGEAQQQRRLVRLVESTRKSVGERFPDLATDETWAAVFADVQRLEDSPRYGGSGRDLEEFLPELLRDVARMHGLRELDPEAASAARQEADARREDRAAEVAPVGSRTSEVRPKPLSKEEQDRQVYDAVRAKYRKKARGLLTG